jgi:hypothetical protein
VNLNSKKSNNQFMPFQLIPAPISIIFILVFGFACMAVLWKLRKTGRIYSILFNVSATVGVLLVVILLYGIITNMH